MDGFKLERSVSIDERTVMAFGQGIGFADSVKSERLNIRWKYVASGGFHFLKLFITLFIKINNQLIHQFIKLLNFSFSWTLSKTDSCLISREKVVYFRKSSTNNRLGLLLRFGIICLWLFTLLDNFFLVIVQLTFYDGHYKFLAWTLSYFVCVDALFWSFICIFMILRGWFSFYLVFFNVTVCLFTFLINDWVTALIIYCGVY